MPTPVARFSSPSTHLYDQTDHPHAVDQPPLSKRQQCEQILSRARAFDLSPYLPPRREGARPLAENQLLQAKLDNFRKSAEFDKFCRYTTNLIQSLQSKLPAGDRRTELSGNLDELLTRLELSVKPRATGSLGPNLAHMWETAVFDLGQINKLIEFAYANPNQTPASSREVIHSTLNNLAEGVTVCVPGCIKNIKHELHGLLTHLFPVDLQEKLESKRFAIAEQVVEREVAAVDFGEENFHGNDTHLVSAWLNVFHKEFGLPLVEEDSYIQPAWTQITWLHTRIKTQLERALQLDKVCDALAEEYLDAILTHMPTGTDTFEDRLNAAIEYLEPTFGHIEQRFLLKMDVTEDGAYELSLTKDSDSLSAFFLHQLANEKYVPACRHYHIENLTNNERGFQNSQLHTYNDKSWLTCELAGEPGKKYVYPINIDFIQREEIIGKLRTDRDQGNREKYKKLIIQFIKSTPAEDVAPELQTQVLLSLGLNNISWSEARDLIRQDALASLTQIKIISNYPSIFTALKDDPAAYHDLLHKVLFTDVDKNLGDQEIDLLFKLGGALNESTIRKGDENLTLTQWALRINKPRLLKLSLSNNINSKKINLLQLLADTSKYGNCECLELISSKIPHSPSTRDAYNALLMSTIAAKARSHRMDKIQFLLQLGVSASYFKTLLNGRIKGPIAEAIFVKDLIVIDLLLTSCASNGIKSPYANALAFHCYNSGLYKHAIQIVCDYGNINVLGPDGLSLLHLAARDDQIELIQDLKDKGANLNLQAGPARMGKTPLHMAQRANNQGAVAKLIGLGADPTVKDYKLRLPEQLKSINQTNV